MFTSTKYNLLSKVKVTVARTLADKTAICWRQQLTIKHHRHFTYLSQQHSTNIILKHSQHALIFLKSFHHCPNLFTSQNVRNSNKHQCNFDVSSSIHRQLNVTRLF